MRAVPETVPLSSVIGALQSGEIDHIKPAYYDFDDNASAGVGPNEINSWVAQMHDGSVVTWGAPGVNFAVPRARCLGASMGKKALGRCGRIRRQLVHRG